MLNKNIKFDKSARILVAITDRGSYPEEFESGEHRFYTTVNRTPLAKRAQDTGWKAAVSSFFHTSASKHLFQVVFLDAGAIKGREASSDLSLSDYLTHITSRRLVMPGGYVVLYALMSDIDNTIEEKITRMSAEADWHINGSEVTIVAKLGKSTVPLKERMMNRNYVSHQVIYPVPDDIVSAKMEVFHGLTITNAEIIKSVSQFGAHVDFDLESWAYPSDPTKVDPPVITVSVAHLLTLTQAGLLNDAIIDTPEGKAAIKSVMRYKTRLVDKAGKPKLRSSKQAQIYVYRDDRVDAINASNVLEFMTENKDALFAVMSERYTPHFDVSMPETAPQKARWIDGVRKIKVQGRYSFLPGQEIAVMAAMDHLVTREEFGLYLFLTQGFGKTPISISMIQLAMDEHLKGEFHLSGNVFAIQTPGNLVEKWEREVKQMIPGVNTLQVVLKDTNRKNHDMLLDVARFYRKAEQAQPGEIFVMIMSQESIKLGEGIEQAGIFSSASNLTFCPNTGIEVPAIETRPRNARGFVSGEEIYGLEETNSFHEFPIEISVGSSVVSSTLHKASRKPIYRNVQANRFATWGEVRRYRKPEKGNGRVTVTVKPATGTVDRYYLTAKKKNISMRPTFCRWELEAWPKRERGVIRIGNIPLCITQVKGAETIITENLTGEPILDPWIATKGTRYNINPRAEVWRLIDRFKSQNAWLFVDEAHNSSGITTDRYSSVSHMARSFSRVINLTGTASRGKASSLRGMESFVNPRKTFAMYPWTAVGHAQWVHDFGIIEQDAEIQEEITGGARSATTGTKRSAAIPEEQNGTNYALVAWMLSHSIFMTLDLLAENMVEFSKVPVELKASGDHLQKYESLIEMTKDEGVSALAKYNLMTQYANAPFDWLHVWGYDRLSDPQTGATIDSERVWIGEVPPTTDLILPKEEAMLKMLEKHISKGEGVAIYVQNTGARDIQDRLKSLAETVPGVKAFILRSKVPQIEREAYINGMYASGHNVLICNPTLVKEGFDLLGSPAIWWHEMTPDVITTLQASHRAYRIPQQHPCTVYFPHYTNTIEAKIASILADKMFQWSVLNGSEVALIEDDESGDIMSQILSEMEGSVSGDIRDKFKKINSLHSKHRVGPIEAAPESSAPSITQQEEEAPQAIDSNLVLDENFKYGALSIAKRAEWWAKDTARYSHSLIEGVGAVFNVDSTRFVLWDKTEAGIYRRRGVEGNVIVSVIEFVNKGG